MYYALVHTSAMLPSSARVVSRVRDLLVRSWTPFGEERAYVDRVRATTQLLGTIVN